jgi:hypothetical protein
MKIDGVEPLPAADLKLATHQNREWFVDLAIMRKTDGSEVKLEDLFVPSVWAKCVGVVRAGDLLRIVAADRTFDFVLKVAAAAQGGLMLAHFPHIPAGVKEAERRVRDEEMAKQRRLNDSMLNDLNSINTRPQ